MERGAGDALAAESRRGVMAGGKILAKIGGKIMSWGCWYFVVLAVDFLTGLQDWEGINRMVVFAAQPFGLA